MDRPAFASHLALLAQAVDRPEAEIDLGQAALLIAESDEPGLEVALHIDHLDRIGDEARRRVTSAADHPVRRLRRLLHEELGFDGTKADYGDPRCLMLHHVLERRTGLPVALGILYLEVARRTGLDVHGVAFPGHFLVQVPEGDERLLVDPGTGAPVTPAELRLLRERVLGDGGPIDPAYLQPVGKRDVLVRLLSSLRLVYSHHGDQVRLRRTVEQLVLLAPSDMGLQRELDRLGGERLIPTPRGSGVN